MVSARHDPAVLAAFQDGERCLVWARRKDVGDLYKLADGTAKELRPWAKEHLECFMPDCGDRRLTTVSRRSKRDGFSHYLGAGGHSAESEAHQQGKAALVAWVQAAYGHLGVVAVAEQSTSDRKRIADVMVTWPDGAQVALEVQYAPLSVEHWQARHDSYREQGITDVWLLGHTSKHLRQARRHSWEKEGATDGLVALGDLHHAMSEAGVPVLWLNPVPADGTAASIGTAAETATPHMGRQRPYGDGHDGATFHVPAAPPTVRGLFLADPLDACALTPDGMTTPSLDRLRQAAALLTSVDVARRADDARRAAADLAAKKAKAERERAAVESRARWLQERKAEQQAAWDTSELKERVLARHGGKMPPLFTIKLGSEGGIYAPPEHWRAAIYKHLVWNKAGTSFTVPAAYAAIHQEVAGFDRSPKGPRSSAVIGWLVHLERQGYVDVVRDPDDHRTVLRVAVRGDLENRPPPRPAPEPPPRPAPAPLPPRQAPAPRAPAPTAARPQPGDPGWAREVARRPNLAPIVRTTPARPAWCRACGLPLDPVLADIGLHILC